MKLHGLIFFLLILSACSPDNNTIKIKGSDTEVNLAVQLAESFHEINSEVFVSITGGGSGLGISTNKIEELIMSLKDHYTIVIVTHNMQQANRISDKVAFMYLGELIEYDSCENVFSNPKEELTRNYVNGHFG